MFAGRLAAQLGAGRLGQAIHLNAWREDPRGDLLGIYICFHMARRKGPVQALQFLDALDKAGFSDIARTDCLSAQAFMYGGLRDFERAFRALDEALAILPERAWLHVTRSYVLSAGDYHDDALAALQQALVYTPYYRPAVTAMAQSLVQLNRIDEAVQTLQRAIESMECGDLIAQLAVLETELNEHEAAREHLEAAAEYYPLIERDRERKHWYAAMCADAAYHCGDIEAAVRFSEQADSPFYKAVAENLQKNRDSGRRVLLDVGFTLQHDATCVPATVSTLTDYWDLPFNHLDIAEAICYDGTPAHAERQWLEEREFRCREFSVTWQAAMQLIDARTPFSLTTVGLGMAHMQAVIGYDSFRGVLIVRDPNVRHSGEYLAEQLIEQMRSTGPRGMAFVPQAEATRLDMLELPDAGLYALSFIHKWFERPVRIQATQSRSLSFFGFQPKWVEALVAVLWLDYCSRRVVSARP